MLIYLSGLIDVLNAHINKHVFGDLQLFCSMQWHLCDVPMFIYLGSRIVNR